MRGVLFAIMLGATLVAVPGARGEPSLPHGCVSMSNDYSIDADAFRRSLGARIHKDEPCSFVYAEGDVYTGSGRFSVACSGGGYFFHPDYRDDRVFQPDVHMPIPQPCSPGDIVTIDGYKALSGGGVVAGGAGEVEAFAALLTGDGIAEDLALAGSHDSYQALCDPGTESEASVFLSEPVSYSGLFTYGGTVRCLGATVSITSVSITGLGGYPAPQYAGSAECSACADALSVSATAKASPWVWDVEMSFEVERPGFSPVQGRRFGRYVASWAGHVTTLYPTPRDDTFTLP